MEQISPEVAESLWFKGNNGEDFFELYCKVNKKKFRKGTSEDDRNGIDYFYDEEEIPIDVKNVSNGVIFGAYKIKDNRFQVRHPFRDGKTGSKSKWFFLSNVNSNSENYELEYLGPIADYLIDKYFLDLKSLREFRTKLNAYNFASFESVGRKSIDDFLYKMMKELTPYLKEGVKISYFSALKAAEIATIKLWIPDPSKRKVKEDIVDDNLPF